MDINLFLKHVKNSALVNALPPVQFAKGMGEAISNNVNRSQDKQQLDINKQQAVKFLLMGNVYDKAGDKDKALKMYEMARSITQGQAGEQFQQAVTQTKNRNNTSVNYGLSSLMALVPALLSKVDMTPVIERNSNIGDASWEVNHGPRVINDIKRFINGFGY
jgi:hypothetical protein